MEPHWLNLAGELLDLASGAFSNHGCNDWRWPDDWTPEQRRALAEAIVRDNEGNQSGALTASQCEQISDYASGEHGPPDWWVMAFLAGRLNPTEHDKCV